VHMLDEHVFRASTNKTVFSGFRCVYDTNVLKVLLERIGADRLVMGSDYPVGEKNPTAFIEQANISKTEKQLICGGNAARLLNLH